MIARLKVLRKTFPINDSYDSLSQGCESEGLKNLKRGLK